VRRHSPEEHSDHHRWVVSYADFITLLFAFFTTLYAISSVDAKKLSEMVASMQMAFDTDARGGDKRPGVPTPLLTAAKLKSETARAEAVAEPQPAAKPVARQAAAPGAGTGDGEISLGDVKERLNERLKEALAQGRLTVELDRRGLVVSIREAGSFATGSAELTDFTRQMILEIAAAVQDIGNAIRIEGHTDDVPIHTGRFRSNWELSTERATSVVAFLIQNARLEATRLSAAGYSEYHPRAPNDCEANRARNRRVDIVILNPATSTAEEPGEPATHAEAEAGNTSPKGGAGPPPASPPHTPAP